MNFIGHPRRIPENPTGMAVQWVGNSLPRRDIEPIRDSIQLGVISKQAE